MADLYKGIAGSPITYLTANISANQTTISIADDSALPDAPNICTIGYGENLETIKYGVKSNGVLQNVTRGIEGTPRAWPAGTEVARFFTAYDHNAIIDDFIAHKTELDNVKTQLAEKAQQEDLNDVESRISPKQVTKPSNFNFVPPFNIFFIGDKFVTDYDIKSEAPTGITYYVDPIVGDDSNDGLSASTPFKRLATALEKSDVRVIKCAPGLYSRAETSGQIMRINKNISIICEKGRAEISKHDRLIYTPNTTYEHVYEAPLANTLDVVDINHLDEEGDYLLLDKANSIQEVSENPNSYYCNGTKIYVRTIDSRNPADTDTVRALRAPDMFVVSNGATLYLENIDIVGGSTNIRTSAENTRILAKNCTFKFAGEGNALTIMGGRHIFEKCVAAKALKDGFNYHIINNNFPKAIEIDCVGRNNGRDGNSINNGSSNHDGGSTIRINGEYYKNMGFNVADTEGCEQWNLGSLAHTSLAIENFNKANFYSACRVAYLEKCRSYGSRHDLTVQANGSNTSKTHLRHFYSTGKFDIKPNSEVLSY